MSTQKYVDHQENEQLKEMVAEFDAALTAVVEAEEDMAYTPVEKERQIALLEAERRYKRASEALAVRMAALWRQGYRLIK